MRRLPGNAVELGLAAMRALEGRSWDQLKRAWLDPG